MIKQNTSEKKKHIERDSKLLTLNRFISPKGNEIVPWVFSPTHSITFLFQEWWKKAQIALKNYLLSTVSRSTCARDANISKGGGSGLGREIDKSYGSMRAERKNFHIYDHDYGNVQNKNDK